MRPAVKAAWHEFSTPLEGRVHCMYLDSAEPEGFVTTAVGILIDPMHTALHLPWKRSDGTLATTAEVVAVWQRVKNMQLLKHRALPQRSDPTLRLTDEDIDALVERKLESNHLLLLRRFPDLDSWPADAQLAIHSWAWAVGAASPYPRMSAHLRAGDFERAATECTINPQRGTIVDRNARNRVLLTNAARVVAHGLDPDVLYWPRELAAEFSEPPPEAA